jgi:phage terminase small subunit
MDTPDRHDEEPTGSGESERPFTVQEVMILELKAAGASNEAAGAAADRSAKTVQRLLRRPEAGALLRELQAERLEQVVGEMGMAVVDAAKVVRAEMRGDRPELRLRAAGLALRGFAELRAAAHQAVVVESLRNKVDALETSLEQIEEGGGE